MLVFLGMMGACTKDPVKVACVGDSITYGADIPLRFLNSYPARLDRMLGRDFEVKNFGVNGSTLLKKGDIPYWQVPEFQASMDFQPDIVVIKLGTNDTKPENWRYSAEFVDDYRELIGRYREANPSVFIFLCIPVPAFEEKWGIAPAIIEKELYPMISDLGEDEGLVVIDLYHPLTGAEEHFPDKIHPNGKGARLIAREVANSILANYQKP